MPTVDLTWTDNASSEGGFRVYRSTTSSPSFPSDYTQIQEISTPNTTSYTDSNAPDDATVSYAVTAYNAEGESGATTNNIETPLLRTATSIGGAGASTTSRTASLRRISASQGQAGASVVSAGFLFERTTATVGDAGASAASREITYNRTAATVGDTGTSTASRTYPGWALDPTDPTPPTLLKSTGETEATPETLSLALTVDREVADTLDTLAQSGDIATSESFGGAFRAALRDAGGARTLEPPGTYQPPFTTSEIVIAGYDESQVAPDRVEVSLELQRTSNRDTEFDPLSQTGAWELTLAESGTIGLGEQQVGQLDASGTTSGREVTLPLLVSGKQAAALLDTLGYPAGVVERSVPDGDNRVVDESGRQAIDIATPDGALIESGEWLCRDWTLTWYSHDESARWRVELVLAQPD